MAALALQSLDQIGQRLDEVGQSTPLNERNWKGTGFLKPRGDSCKDGLLKQSNLKPHIHQMLQVDSDQQILHTQPVRAREIFQVKPRLEAQETNCGRVLNFGRALQ